MKDKDVTKIVRPCIGKLISYIHEEFGHVGYQKLSDYLGTRYYWQNMSRRKEMGMSKKIDIYPSNKVW